MSGRWSGREVTNARKHWAARLPVACCRCGRPVTADTPWQVDHWPVPREFGGTETWPAHSHCNLSAGGKRGAQITAAKRLTNSVKSSRVARIEQRPMRW